MHVDWYIKAILTVIAACLVWMCVNGAIPVASAQAPARPTPVILVDQNGAPAITAQGLRVNLGTQAVPVTLAQTVPVAITSIERRGTWQPVIVDVLKQPPTLMPTP
jgi:hypothetical protein